MHRLKTRAALLLSAAALASACGDDPIRITAPEPPASIIESVEGTLTPFSARTFNFQAQTAGAISVHVASLTPNTTIVGLSLGTSDGVTCQAAVSTEVASMGFTLFGIARSAGTLCARIYDPTEAGLPAPVPFTLEITY